MEAQHDFPNGFISWRETHYEISSMIQRIMDVEDNDKGVVGDVAKKLGSTGLYELALQWTDEFEQENRGRSWDGEFIEEVEKFIQERNRLKKMSETALVQADVSRSGGGAGWVKLKAMNYKYNVLTGLVHSVCKPYRTNVYWKALVALLWRKIKFGRGYIIRS